MNSRSGGSSHGGRPVEHEFERRDRGLALRQNTYQETLTIIDRCSRTENTSREGASSTGWGVPGLKTLPLLSMGMRRRNLDPERAAEGPAGIVRLRAVVKDKHSVVTAIAKEGAAECSDSRRCSDPA